VSIINVTIINNTAIQGGGILVSGATDLVVRNVVLRNNVAAISGGGAFFHQVKNGVLDNVLAESNIAGSSGGGIALSASYFDITRFSGILNRAKVGCGSRQLTE
jgi:predicted outer membrane repeat protein